MSPRLKEKMSPRSCCGCSHWSPASSRSCSDFSGLTTAGHRINGINIINSRGVLSDDEWIFRLTASAALPSFLFSPPCVAKTKFSPRKQNDVAGSKLHESDSAVLLELDNAISSLTSQQLTPKPVQPAVRVSLTCKPFKIVPSPAKLTAFSSVEWSKLSKVFKVNLYGPSNCGKTALLKALEGQCFDPVGWPTKAPYFKFFGYKDLTNPSDSQSTFALQIWDGANNNEQMIGSFFKCTRGVVICYAVDDPNGLDVLVPFMNCVKKHVMNSSSLIFLLGCKSDKPSHISYETAQKYAQSNNAIFLGECSSRTLSNVDSVFCSIAHRTLIQCTI